MRAEAWRPRVALVLDHPQRDLDGIVLVAAELCQRGLVCHIVPASLRARELWALQPDFVLLYHLRLGFEPLLRQLGEAGIRVGVLDNEGGVWPELKGYTELLTPAAELRAQVRFLCAWGPALGTHLVEAGLFRAEQVVVTGAPRFDLYRDPWRVRGASDARRPRVLINTSYSEANPRFGGLDGVYRHLAGTFGWSTSRIDDIVAAQQTALHGTIELAQRLADDFPAADVVLRPHPFEAVDTYANAADRANLSVEFSGTIQAAIASAAVAVQRTSTTAVEACLGDIPAIAPMWLPAAYPLPIVESVSERVATYGELRGTVAAILDHRYAPSAELRTVRNAVISAWFHRADGLAHRRVADTVTAHLPATPEVRQSMCTRYLYGLDGSRRRLIERAGKLLRFGLRMAPDWSFRERRGRWGAEWAETDQYFGAAEIRASLDRVLAARQAAGQAAEPIVVAQGRDRGDFARRFAGHSVTLGLNSAESAVTVERSA